MDTFDTPRPVQLVVVNGAGMLTVDAVDTTETTVSLTPQDSQAEKLIGEAVVVQRGDAVVVRLPRGRGGPFRGAHAKVAIDVRVPTGSSLKTELDSSDLRTSGALDTLSAKLGSGDATVDTVTGDARIDTGSGDVRIERCDGSLKWASGSGDLTAGEVGARATTRCGSGDVAIERAGGSVSSGSGSGDITIGSSDGDVVAKSGSGDVQVGHAHTGEIGVTTASGDVEVSVVDGTAVWLDLNTHSGEVRSNLQAIEYPEDSERQLRLRVKTASGDISVARC